MWVGCGSPSKSHDENGAGIQPLAPFGCVMASTAIETRLPEGGHPMTPRNAELREIPSACKDLSDTERLVFEAQYARHRRDPAIATILSFFLLDRFYVGQAGAGFAKVFTLGGLGLWALIDLFIIRRIAAEQNATAIRDVKAHLADA